MMTSLRSLFVVMVLAVLFAGSSVFAQEPDEDVLEQGEYIANIAGCFTCHTPLFDKYNDFANLPAEDMQTLALFEHNAFDASRAYGGGRPFDLGPGGVIFGANITPDEETGIGTWTPQEIKDAIRLGVSRDGRNLHPIMPAHLYNGMAESDLDALVAYLLSLEPVSNLVPTYAGALPPRGLTPPEPAIEAADPADPAARGAYLMRGVLPCQECHTPINLETGIPEFDKYLAGGQPFEGPWGIAYAANITADEATGIGGWSDEEVLRAVLGGVREDGRRIILMPWQDYGKLTLDDQQAVLHYLRNEVPAVNNEVPAVALLEGFEQFVDQSGNASEEESSSSATPLVIGLVVLVAVLVLGGLFYMRRQKA